MKIIFLDFDGVLNNQLFYTKNKNERRSPLDPDNITLLNSLCKDTEASVVVTSTWRLGRSVDQLQQILEDNGFTGTVIDKTTDMRHGEHADCILRGNEVLAWIKDNPSIIGAPYWDYKEYVILDDDSDFLYWQRNNLIIVDPYVGLTPKNIYIAKRILLSKTQDSSC